MPSAEAPDSRVPQWPTDPDALERHDRASDASGPTRDTVGSWSGPIRDPRGRHQRRDARRRPGRDARGTRDGLLRDARHAHHQRARGGGQRVRLDQAVDRRGPLRPRHAAQRRPGPGGDSNQRRPARARSTLPLASSREARIGQEIIAIGSPLGLQNTVTRGIVSALRQVGAVVLVQTDAAINPGNSGGPLLDRSGRVVAVATMRMSGRAEALGFGVGAEHVRAMLDGRAPQSCGQRPADAVCARAGPTTPTASASRARRVYERFLVEAAKRADQLDASWTDFVTDCLSGRAPSTRSDRGWYVLWERFDESKVSPACTRFFADFKMAARGVRTPHDRGRRSRARRWRVPGRLPSAPSATPPRLSRLVAARARNQLMS